MQFPVAYDRSIQNKENLSPTFMKGAFVEKIALLACETQVICDCGEVQAAVYGTENIQYKCSTLWPSLPSILKGSGTDKEFERRIT